MFMGPGSNVLQFLEEPHASKVSTVVVLSGFLFVGERVCEKDGNNKLNSTDRDFITAAQRTNLAEIEATKMLEGKTSDTALKEFAINSDSNLLVWLKFRQRALHCLLQG
jgi:hypothetical protein